MKSEKINLIYNLVDMIDRFQNNERRLNYSFTVSSCEENHRVICHITGENKRIDFQIDETYSTNEVALFEIIKQKTDELLYSIYLERKQKPNETTNQVVKI